MIRHPAFRGAAALILLLLCSLPSTAVHAQQPAPERTTYVIVHGAWGGGWDWRAVDSLLTAQGHRVYRPDLTGLGSRSHLISANVGLDTHVTDIANLLLWEDLKDVVLVGHSYGGMVITGVADRVPDRIRELVYVDAILPQSGENAMALFPAEMKQMFAASVRDGLMIPSWEPADKPVPKDVPHPARTFTDTLRLEQGPTRVAGRYILTVEPTEQPDTFQPFADRAAARNWPVLTMQAGHVPERTHPLELTQLLLGKK